MKDVTTLEFYSECTISMDLELSKMKKKQCALFRSAAVDGHSGGQCMLAHCYFFGLGVDADESKQFDCTHSQQTMETCLQNMS